MEIDDAVRALAALAQDTRLAVFRLLVRAGDDALPAGDIAEQLSVPAATLSFHLAALRRAGLVSRERRGRQLLYRADQRGVRALLGYLSEDCCQGQPALCGLGMGPGAARGAASRRAPAGRTGLRRGSKG